MSTIEIGLPVFDETLVREALRMDHHINDGKEITSEEIDRDLARYRTEWQQYKASGKTEPFVPSGVPVDRIWHAHMCVPQQYGPDCETYFGRMLEHSVDICLGHLPLPTR
jgi:hypothetical protein